MKLLYIVNTAHNEDAYRTYARVHMAGRATPMGRALAIILGIVIAAGGAIALAMQGFRLLYLATLFIGLLSIFSQPLGVLRMKNRLLRNAQDMNMHIDYRFGEDQFTVVYPGQQQTLAYPDVLKLVETRNYYFLYTDVKMAHILAKADFTQGSAQSFGKFVSEKSGQPLLSMDI